VATVRSYREELRELPVNAGALTLRGPFDLWSFLTQDWPELLAINENTSIPEYLGEQ
jgi:hypothetical protein